MSKIVNDLPDDLRVSDKYKVLDCFDCNVAFEVESDYYGNIGDDGNARCDSCEQTYWDTEYQIENDKNVVTKTTTNIV